MADIRHALWFIAIAGSIFVLSIAFEWGYLFHRGNRSSYDLREVLANICTGIMYKGLDGVIVALFVTWAYDDVVKFGLPVHFSSTPVKIAAAFLITDITYFALHWLMHKTRYGWSSHVTHHSSTRFNLAAALRQNFLFDLSGLVILWCLPMALVGFDRMTAVVAIELNLAYQFFIHTEVVDRLPAWCEAIFNTPSHHRVHHSDVPGEMESNLGGVLIVWDRLFGTFLDERDVGKINYGIPHRPLQTLNPLRLNLEECFRMWRDVWRNRDISLLWKHPDWLEDDYHRRTGATLRLRPPADAVPVAHQPQSAIRLS
jgi:sterol desaturase/sphingolipid hydroxylase (fatty acid hydroxylase superfamily)